jgi:CYTH domain-containing protein/8-oxo-dGTP pyrophosphatase MutT (NUDIX family)
MHPAIERKFLVTGKLPHQAVKNRAMTLELGFLTAQGHRDVCLRKSKNNGFLMVGKGRGRLRHETQRPLADRDFKVLWQLTEDSRITKTRSSIRAGGCIFVLEVIKSHGTTVQIATVSFASPAESKAFQKPGIFGEEITGMEDYSDAHLAVHGPPPVRSMLNQAGAVPFLFKNGVLHIVLVTSSSGTRWLVPKGSLEAGMTRQEVALMEAAEEAGAIGTIEQGVSTVCRLDDNRTVHLYPLRVATLLQHWPERALRRRVVLPVYRALLRIQDLGLARSIRELSRQLEP